MTELTTQLQADLTIAMKNRETVRAGAIRMTLSAIKTEQVAGKVARELSEEEVRKVLSREVKKRKEAAEAFANAGRVEKAELELAESQVIESYLPAQLDDVDLSVIVDNAVAQVAEQLGEQPGQRQMGQIIKAVNEKAAGRAEGSRIAAAVKARLTS